jgi:putative hydrolase of the HAD superfamily
MLCSVVVRETVASMISKPKAVLFDLDGTLFDRDSSFVELLRAQYQTFAAALEQIPHDVFVQRVIELDEHGYVDKTIVYRDIAREFGLPQTLAGRLTTHFQEAYASFSRCFPEVPSALTDLRADGLKLGIITNGSTHMQEQKIHQLGLADLMDEVLISEREGLRKPEPQIFERALERLHVAAAEAWYVGDHPIVDIRGSFNAGLTPVWRQTSYWRPPDVPCHRIDTLDELVEILI